MELSSYEAYKLIEKWTKDGRGWDEIAKDLSIRCDTTIYQAESFVGAWRTVAGKNLK